MSDMNAAAVTRDESGQFYLRVVGSDVYAQVLGSSDIIMRDSLWFIDAGYYCKISTAIDDIHGVLLCLRIHRVHVQTLERNVTKIRTCITWMSNFDGNSIRTVPCDNGRIGILDTGSGWYYIVRYIDGCITIDKNVVHYINVGVSEDFITWDPYRKRLHAICQQGGRLREPATGLDVTIGVLSYVDTGIFVRDGILTLYDGLITCRISIDTNTLLSSSTSDTRYMRRIMLTEHIQVSIDTEMSCIHLVDMRNGDEYDIDVLLDGEVLYNRLVA